MDQPQSHMDNVASVHTRKKLEGMFTALGLRGFGRVGTSKHESERTTPCVMGSSSGYPLLISSTLLVLFYLYAAIFSKMMPPTGIFILNAIREDEYFCFLIPLLILPTFLVVYLNWLAFQLL